MLLISEIDRLKKEWGVVRDAPVSFLIVCLIAVGVTWTVFHYTYKNQLDSAHDEVNRWKSNSEYWEDQTKHAPLSGASPLIEQTTGGSFTATSVPSAHRKISRGSLPPVTQTCPNGICNSSTTVSGTQTVNNNYGPPERILSDDQKSKITAFLRGKTVKISFGYTIASPDALQYAAQICSAVMSAIPTTDCSHIEPWAEDRGDGSYGLVFMYKGDRVPQGTVVHFAPETPVGTIINALLAAGINQGSASADPKLPDDEAIVLVGLAPVQPKAQ